MADTQKSPKPKTAPKGASGVGRKIVDWDALYPHYHAGIRAFKDIGAEFGVSDAAIIKKARKEGWTRELKARLAKDNDRSVKVSTRDPLDAVGYVYCIKIEAGGEKLFKVGMAKSPDVRLAAHQTSLPFDAVICIAYFVPSMRQEEKVLHDLFESKRIRGEWYRLDGDDLNAIAMRARLV